MTYVDQKTVETLGGASSFSMLCPDDAAQVSAIMEQRLMIALCMKEVPTENPELMLWKQLLASAITSFSMLDYDGVKSESVRNYSYTLSDGSGSWDTLYKTAGDLLSYFSKCHVLGGSISFQTDVTWFQYSCWSDKIFWPVGGAI